MTFRYGLLVLDGSGDLPGLAVDEVVAKPHRRMTEEELQRYNLPPGTIIMANSQVQYKRHVTTRIPDGFTDFGLGLFASSIHA